MAASIDTYLYDLSYKYYISHSSTEGQKIETSVNGTNGIKSKLSNHFGSNLLSVSTFGSYERDTILPRTYDNLSDVDILVKFNHDALNHSAETYRTWLLKFADANYTRSPSYKSFPTVVVELQHIAFDLVPAIDMGSWVKVLHIPNSNNQWQPTNPIEFNKTVTDANVKYGYIVKPIIRLMKAWNAMASYPYSTYGLEKQVASFNFSGDNYQKGFFYATSVLSTTGLSASASGKVETLRNNVSWVKHYLDKDDADKAKEWLHRILPYA